MSVHADNLRAYAGKRNTTLIKPSLRDRQEIESIFAAADHIDELESNMRILQRLNSIKPSEIHSELDERVKVLEGQVKNFVTKFDLEQTMIERG